VVGTDGFRRRCATPVVCHERLEGTCLPDASIVDPSEQLGRTSVGIITESGRNELILTGLPDRDGVQDLLLPGLEVGEALLELGPMLVFAPCDAQLNVDHEDLVAGRVEHGSELVEQAQVVTHRREAEQVAVGILHRDGNGDRTCFDQRFRECKVGICFDCHHVVTSLSRWQKGTTRVEQLSYDTIFGTKWQLSSPSRGAICYTQPMSNGYTTIFFDWGGVVADDPGDEFLTLLLRNLGASDEQVHEIFKTYMKRFMRDEISEKGYWDALKTNYGFTIDDSISDEFMKWTGLVANEEILALVDEAKAKGLRTAILSNVIEPTYNVLDRAGFYARFDETIASCKVGYAKPQREIYDLALEKLGATAEQSIFIDDKQKNLDPADEMGFTTVLAQNPTQIIRDLQNLISK